MKVVVDRELCEANFRCVAAAPEIFSMREDSELEIAETDIPVELLKRVAEAVQACPKAALTLTED